MDDDAVGFDAERLIGLGRVTAVVPAPDGTWAVAVVERLDRDGQKYVSNLHRVALDAPYTPPRALTVGESRDRAPTFRHDGALLFLSDRPLPGAAPDDDKRAQVWLLPDQGEPRPVTDEPLGVRELRAAAHADVLVVLTDVLPGVPHEEQRAAAKAKKKETSLRHYHAMPVRFWDHWLPEAEIHAVAYVAGARVDLTPDAGHALREAEWDLSADGAVVAVAWAVPNPADRIDDRPLALIDVAGGARRLLGAEPGNVHGQPRFSPDGRLVVASRYTRTPERYGSRSIVRYGVGSGTAKSLTDAWDRWPEAVAFTPDGRQVLCDADDEGHHALFLVDIESGGVDRVSPAADGGSYDATAVVPGQRLAVTLWHDMLRPPEPHLIELAAPSAPRALARLSGFDAARASGLATRRSVRVDVGGGRSVQTFVVEPVEPPAEQRAFFWIHGGPVSAWNDGWHWRWAPLALAAAGYTVVLPNPAGSTGFGNDWVNDIWGNTWGGRCYDDLMAVVDGLERQGVLRAADTVVMGGSFGGYMTNWIGANEARFRLLVTHASIYGMATFHGATDVPAWWALMVGHTPWSDPAAFDHYAPSRLVSRWRTPTLVIHGEKDYRVPIGEALALFEALQAHGVPSELAIYPDEGHHVLKPRNIVAWYRTVLDFVARRWG
ncbi:MAG: S9 family peptidase [Deltaproteobacteria bacterium]|nr:S9 family peptidase [Deltaproteobacteria bacterium]